MSTFCDKLLDLELHLGVDRKQDEGTSLIEIFLDLEGFSFVIWE